MNERKRTRRKSMRLKEKLEKNEEITTNDRVLNEQQKRRKKSDRSTNLELNEWRRTKKRRKNRENITDFTPWIAKIWFKWWKEARSSGENGKCVWVEGRTASTPRIYRGEPVSSSFDVVFFILLFFLLSLEFSFWIQQPDGGGNLNLQYVRPPGGAVDVAFDGRNQQ